MEGLIEEIANYICRQVQTAVGNLQRADGEIRTVFHGPPLELLEPVFTLLSRNGGVEATLGTGEPIVVPVLLQVVLAPGESNPPLGASGRCEAIHLISLRNAPAFCPRFVALVEPGQQANLSFSSASDDFGLSSQNNSGAATTQDWWRDDFIKGLVDRAIERRSPPVRDGEQAYVLVEKAVFAADQIDKHVASRHGSWRVLSRLWSDQEKIFSFGTAVSLACGFPPMEDGSVDAASQLNALTELTDRMVDGGFKSTVEQLKDRADEDESEHLDELLRYLQKRCETPMVLGRAPPFYYGPCADSKLEKPPSWWSFLSVARLRQLLDASDETPPADAALVLQCLDPLLPRLGSGPFIVASTLTLSVHDNGIAGAPESVSVKREMSGAAFAQWSLTVNHADAATLDKEQVPGHVLVDDSIPQHKTPVRFTVEGPGIKKGAIRVVSMATWEPSFVVYSRTASKIVLPKKTRRKTENVAYETSLVLSGDGRHYFDVHVKPGTVIGPNAYGSGEDGSVDPARKSEVAKVSDSLYGFEAEASGDCFYQLQIRRGGAEGTEACRIYLTCDEVAAEECGSEFERLIRMNRHKSTARASTDIHINRQHRSTDLQGWMLAKDQANDSFRPFVLASDYASSWRARDWGAESQTETIVSAGRFLHDPRPSRGEMSPPQRFVEARAKIMRKVRGEDENGLIEAAPLGLWVANDPDFAELVEEYVQSYSDWLEFSPDTAAWCDVGIVAGFESDGTTLSQEPDAVIVSPLHPVRFAWHCAAQRALYQSQRKMPCPAASILDPDAVPDALVLPMRTAAGGLKFQVFFSVECSSDYWAILWNGSKLDRVPQASRAPFDKEFGVLVGGISSGFSMSQVQRSLGDIAEMFSAKPVLNILLTSSGGQNNACNEGILEWCRDRFGANDDSSLPLRAMGSRFIQIIDERPTSTRPEDAEVSNLAEDTANTARWMGKGDGTIRPDLAIIAQLETSSPSNDKITYGSPIGAGGLIRHRIRQQLSAGNGAFLSESRMASPRSPSGDGLLDKTASALVRYENVGAARFGYTFAPSVHAIRAALDKADYAAVSSSAVDPACFLGAWLNDTYLWDYDLPSYSHRSGDSNGYYLLSKVKDLDRETLGSVLSKLPDCQSVSNDTLDQVILEVARRGIPTVKGLSRGDSGASGDLGLFVAARLIQDEFRTGASKGSLLPVLSADGMVKHVTLLIPVDPFRGYIDDLGRALSHSSHQRPDFVVACLFVSESKVTCRLTAVEVKYRGSTDPMSSSDCKDALQQARAFSEFIAALRSQGDDQGLLTWKLAFQHLISSMLGFGLRVYSQRAQASNWSQAWSGLHSRIMESIFSDEIDLQVDPLGRLIVIDGSKMSGSHDLDGDGFAESIKLNRIDAGAIANGDPDNVYAGIKRSVGQWRLLPEIDRNSTIQEARKDEEGALQPRAPVEGTPIELRPEYLHDLDVPSDEQLMPTPQESQDTVVVLGYEDAGGIDILVGETIEGFQVETRRLNLGDTSLNQLNMGVVGDLGTGKTQLLKSLIKQILQSKSENRGITPRFLIFDYKKDYISEDFVKATGARVVKPQHLPINLFDTSGAGSSIAPWLDRFKFFNDVLEKIFSGIGPVQRQNLKTAVRQAYEDAEAAGRQSNIYDVHAKYRAIIGNKPDSPFAIIDDLVDSQMFAPAPVNGDAFDKFLDGVVVISLGELGQDDRTKSMLVAIMLNVFYEHMLKIPKRPFLGTSPQLRVVDSFLLVDEADNIMRYEFDVLRKVLLQGREFGVGVILASQYLRHFKVGATDYREPLLTWLIHKVPNITPQELGSLGLVGDVTKLAEQIKSLANHNCLYKTFDVGGDLIRGKPFFELMRDSRPEK